MTVDSNEVIDRVRAAVGVTAKGSGWHDDGHSPLRSVPDQEHDQVVVVVACSKVSRVDGGGVTHVDEVFLSGENESEAHGVASRQVENGTTRGSSVSTGGGSNASQDVSDIVGLGGVPGSWGPKQCREQRLRSGHGEVKTEEGYDDRVANLCRCKRFLNYWLRSRLRLFGIEDYETSEKSKVVKVFGSFKG